MEYDILEIAKDIQKNNKDEASAIAGYTELMQKIFNSGLEDKEEMTTTIEEIIADELNHQELLKKLYVDLTDIEPKKN